MPRYISDATVAYVRSEALIGDGGPESIFGNDSFGDATLSTFSILGLSHCGADGHINYPLVRVRRNDGSFSEHHFSDWGMWADDYLNDIAVVNEVYDPMSDKVMMGRSDAPKPITRHASLPTPSMPITFPILFSQISSW